MQEVLVLVDNQDNEIGQAEKLNVHQSGNLHRAFSIFIFRLNDGKLELLLQQRNSNKYHCGNLWTNTCCGHPRVGEGIVVAAERRLYEEMLFHTTLIPLDTFYYYAACNNGFIEHELDHVLIGNYHNEIVRVNTNEVQNFRWLTIDAIEQELMRFPDKFTPWFAKALALVKKHRATIMASLFAIKDK